MSLYFSLPADIHRIVACYLTVDEISKIPLNIDDNDVLWKIKASTMTKAHVDYKMLCTLLEEIKKYDKERLYFTLENFEEFFSNKGWDQVNYEEFINNETFLTKYIDILDDLGRTLLFHLCLLSSYIHILYYPQLLSLIEKLIKRGANVNFYLTEKTTTLQQRTPLSAIFYINPRPEVLKILLDAGADPLLKNDDDLSALDWARQRGMFVELLEQYL
jgi:hypothetical protein